MSVDFKNGVFAPVLTAVLLGVGGKMYYNVEEKLEQINTLIEKHPELEETLENLEQVKEELSKEYKVFKGKTNYRLNKLETKEEVDLTPIKAELKRDSLKINSVSSGLEYLKSLH